jgi:myo-inositol-1(or 4)-monophosphatase
MQTLSDTQARDLLAFADELADAARAAILPHFRVAAEIETKAGALPGFDPVTAADRAAEAAMRALIEARFPTHGIIGEEFPEKPARDGFTWVLDPIDGTRAFISGLPLWGVLIALAHQGRPIIGIIDQPYIGERFRGWPGGADVHTRAGVRPLQVRGCAGLGEATMATTDPHLFIGAEALAVEQVRGAARLARFGCDCYAYAMIAMGFIDLVIESGLAPWDVGALVPVIEGAGGLVTNWRGAPVWQGDWFAAASGRTQIVAAGDARAHAEALAALRAASTG